MSTDTHTEIFSNGLLSVYSHLDDPEFPRCTISGELTVAVLGEDFDHQGLASNHEAEEAVKARLRAENPTLLAFTEFDSESGCFFAYTKTEAAAIELAGFITAMALENERKAGPEPVYRRQERTILRGLSAADADQAAGRQVTREELHALETDPVLKGLRAEALKRVAAVLNQGGE